jgi:hypothetical protein
MESSSTSLQNACDYNKSFSNKFLTEFEGSFRGSTLQLQGTWSVNHNNIIIILPDFIKFFQLAHKK